MSEPFLALSEPQEAPERDQTALAGRRRERPAIASRPRGGPSHGALVRPKEVTINGSHRGIALAMLVDELLEPCQLVAIPGDGARNAVPVELHPLKELVDGLGERDGGLGASHPAILRRNILKSTFSSVSSIRSHRTHVRG